MSDTPQRGALMLVRVTAVALISVTVLQLLLYLADLHYHDHPIPILSCVLWSIPLVIAVVLLVKAKAAAQWISDKLE